MSCSNDSDGGSIQFELKAVNTASKATVQKIGNANVIFTDFRISIRDVVFKNEDDPNSSLDTDEIQFRGAISGRFIKWC